MHRKEKNKSDLLYHESLYLEIKQILVMQKELIYLQKIQIEKFDKKTSMDQQYTDLVLLLYAACIYAYMYICTAKSCIIELSHNHAYFSIFSIVVAI